MCHQRRDLPANGGRVSSSSNLTDEVCPVNNVTVCAPTRRYRLKVTFLSSNEVRVFSYDRPIVLVYLVAYLRTFF